jgi:hypothetical protein
MEGVLFQRLMNLAKISRIESEMWYLRTATMFVFRAAIRNISKPVRISVAA